jgi:hypothetical protein
MLGILSVCVTGVVYRFSKNDDFKREFNHQIKNGIINLYTGEIELKYETIKVNVKTPFTVFFDIFQVLVSFLFFSNYLND